MITEHLRLSFAVSTNFTKFSSVIEPCCFFFFLFKTMKIQRGLSSMSQLVSSMGQSVLTLSQSSTTNALDEPVERCYLFIFIFFLNQLHFVKDWLHTLLYFSKNTVHLWFQLFEQHSVIHSMIFSAARFRTARYYSRHLSPDNTEQQRSQGREKIQGKPCGTSKSL